MLHDKHIHVKVSIITVVRNAVGKIEPTVRSVLAQDYGNLEYIVIDGLSTDGTVDIINRYRERIASFVSERDEGIYDALNKGVLQATGDWIGIMNAGDVFSADDVLSKIFGATENNFCCDVIYGDSISVSGGVESCCKASECIADLEKGPCYRHGASFVRRDVHRKYLFDLTKRQLLDFALDYEQIYRMYKGGVSFRKIPLEVVKYELRGASTASPFRVTYCNYLITHGMKCGLFMKLVLGWLTLWRGLKAVVGRVCEIDFVFAQRNQLPSNSRNR